MDINSIFQCLWNSIESEQKYEKIIELVQNKKFNDGEIILQTAPGSIKFFYVESNEPVLINAYREENGIKIETVSVEISVTNSNKFYFLINSSLNEVLNSSCKTNLTGVGNLYTNYRGIESHKDIFTYTFTGSSSICIIKADIFLNPRIYSRWMLMSKGIFQNNNLFLSKEQFINTYDGNCILFNCYNMNIKFDYLTSSIENNSIGNRKPKNKIENNII
jgi:hypothetical protein